MWLKYMSIIIMDLIFQLKVNNRNVSNRITKNRIKIKTKKIYLKNPKTDFEGISLD